MLTDGFGWFAESCSGDEAQLGKVMIEDSTCKIKLCMRKTDRSPNETDDTVAMRRKWFIACLENLVKEAASLGTSVLNLPRRIGCGFEGGDPKDTRSLLSEFV